MDFGTLVEQQYVVGQEIQQFIESCKKAPLERRTPQFYDNKLKVLQELADKFHNTHSEILRLREKDLEDQYFKDNYYDQVQKLVGDYTKRFEARAMERISNVGTDGGAKSTSSALNSQNVDLNIRKLMRNQRALIFTIRQGIDEIMENREVVQPPSYYTITATVLEKHMMDLAKNNAALWEATDEDKIEDYDLKTYYEIETNAKRAMIELQQHMPRETNQSVSRAPDTALQLPRISLPKFNGDYLQWAAFKDLYIELVHNAQISDSQRMHYLLQALTDEPKNLIKHLPSIGTNYTAAWLLLTNRYDNKRLQVSSLLNKLLSQPTIKGDSPASIKALHDVTRECIHGLTSQGLPVQQWDAILAHLIIRKMDQTTQTAFEQNMDDNKRLPTQEEVLKFLERRFQSLEARGVAEKSAKRTCASVTKPREDNCLVCKGTGHKLYACKTFTGADLNQKWKWVKDLKLCVNCLKGGHLAEACKSQHCTKCPKKHNTLMHNEKGNKFIKAHTSQSTNAETRNTNSTNDNTSSEQSTNKVSLLANSDANYVLLGTARINLVAANGQTVECRAILDSGSQVNLITEKLLKRLKGTTTAMSMSIEGVGSNETKMQHRTTIILQSRITNFTAEVEAHVIKKIVSDQPVQHIHINKWGMPADLILADPEFNKPGKIDCLLGAEIFFDLLQDGQIKMAKNLPTLKKSVLGWIVAGNVGQSDTHKAICGICTTSELEKTVSDFWESEEVPDSKVQLNADELRCEAHFLQHTVQDENGKFIVKLPLKDHPSVLSQSKGIAYQRFQSLERRFERDQPLKAQYVEFMKQYEALGHMTKIDENNIKKPHYFIPHHCVLRPDSISTKLRVVFDASARKLSGSSLNDILYTGPVVQKELFSILLQFRMRKYVLKTDIEKMYRQIWVNHEDRQLQLILWREHSSQPLGAYQLNTVTYGTRAAPYLATRCLVQLAHQNLGRFPLGATALKNNFYVDDGLVGADSLWEALEIQSQLITILNSAGMKLKKWSANNPKLLRGISPEDQEVDLNFESEERQSTKTLGLSWLPKSDMICIKSNLQENERITKRTMSSDLAHIYDPLGLIGPVLVTGKIQLQNLWKLKLDWDAQLPSEIEAKWTVYRRDLASLEKITFSRHVLTNQDKTNIQLHAFADASEKAFGAAIYIRTTQKDKTVKVNLLCSRSRVAPIKQQTIPRLELCAALLAAELMTRVKIDLDYQDKPTYFWTDSQIVLSWINNHPGNMPVYIAHRTIKILRTTIPDQWRHVPSKQNPADILSRGIRPHDLQSCHMWFFGPMFLFQQELFWPAPFKREPDSEITKTVATVTNQGQTEEQPWIYMIPSKNSFSHVQRVVGYVLRFIKNTKHQKDSRPKHTSLSPLELDMALKLVIKQIQMSEFLDIKKTLTKEQFVPKSNHLSSLTPFLDEEGIIRVGGRLNSSDQQFDAKHQMILPNNDPLVKLLIEKMHRDNYHCGPQALLAQVRQRFWPLKGKSLTRAVVQRCVKCTRARPVFYRQLMGNLPEHRVQPSRPFLNSGVDYCGPFFVHFKVRGKRPQKAYIAVFCCFSTKAVHLELVTDLTTEAFIGALKRFIARRGHCKTLYCDNATNFVGARNQLKEIDDIIYAEAAQESIIGECSKRAIDFQFIPPRSPHFGGLWEAAVKSAKHLLMKNVSTASLTYEEMETIVIEIEAILNSRPLTPSSSDANDFNALTPAHFLIGEELTSSVDVKAKEPKGRLMERWQLVSQLKRNFWNRWSKEYLNELQQRHKWKGPITNIPPNTMVIIKEDNLPVLQWPLGRIIKIYKGNDNVVRVCDVQTQKGVFKRPVHRLAPLFQETESERQLEETSQPASLPISIPLHRIKNTSFLATEEAPTKRARLNPSLLLTILTLFLLPLALGSQINITNFNNKPGIYFEQLGTIKLLSANWKMIVYFDLEPYQQQLNIISDGTATLQKLCDNVHSNTSCTLLLNYFDHVIEEIQADLSLFSTKRIKRGAIDIIGNFANSLFGVLDSNYATQMSNTIEKLKKSDAHIEGLFKNQTSLIDSTINLVKRNQLEVQAKFDEIDSKIHNLLYANGSTNDIQVMQNILMLSIQMFMIVSNIRRIHSSIMDVLIDSHHDKINPLLLTPQQLNTEILKIKAHLPEHLQLPIHQKNLMEIYKLITINGIVAENHVIFSIDLPLTDHRQLQLLHLVPIIASINSTLTSVKLSTKFLGISSHRDEFFPITQRQLDSCYPLDNNDVLCPNNQATYQSAFHPMVNECEIDLFNSQDDPRCALFKLEDTTTWYQLHHPNQWIFATLNSVKLNAVCEGDTTQLTIKGSGLMTLSPGCTVKTDSITILGHQQMVTSLKTSITKLSPSITWTKQYASNNISNKAFTPTVKELEQIQRQLAQITSFTSVSDEKSSNAHGVITGYTAIALVLIIALLMTYKWKKPTTIFQPTPLPRQQTTEC